MSSSVSQWTKLRHFVFSSLIVFCSLGLFFMYYQPDISFLYCGTCNVSENKTDPPSCPTVQYSPTQKIQVADGEAEHDTILLIWMWPFGVRFELSCSMFNITGCHMTDDKTLYSKAHGVLFHHRDIEGKMANMPKEPRPWFQKWVWLSMESPANSPLIPQLDHLFNVTCSYRLDSNVPAPYGKLFPVTNEAMSFKLPAKDKLVCWIVSNWNGNYKRVHFYNELKKYIKIEVYGTSFGRPVNNKDFSKIISSCKFYLSLENSIDKDYITEKFYNPMMMGTVPVVLGPPRLNYEVYVPGESFIHVDDFASPKELAERLLYLDQHHAEYMSYFHWRERFKAKRSNFQESACRSCDYLQKNRGCQVFNNLNKWYWG